MNQQLFSERLTEARVRRGLSKAALARAVGISDISVGDFELRGKTPALDTAMRLAHALGVTVGWLCGEDEPAGATLGKHPGDQPPPADLSRCAKRFEEARLAAGLNPARVAQMAGCDVEVVDRLERAEEWPPVSVRRRLAEAVRVTPEHLFGGADGPPGSQPEGAVTAVETAGPYWERLVRTLEVQTEIARTQANANAEQAAANHAQADANHALAAALRSQSEAMRAVADRLPVSHSDGRGAVTAAGNE